MKCKISIILLFLSIIVYSKDDYRILSSDQNSIVIEYTPRYTDTSITTIDNQEFRNVALDLGVIPNPDAWGNPAVPERRINLGVPAEFGNTIEVLNTQYVELKGQVIPIPKLVKEGGIPANKFVVGKEYFSYEDNPELVLFGNFGITRRLNNQEIRILPVKFDAQTKKIKLYKQIVFRVQYGRGGSTTTSNKYDELLRSACINYDVARFWQQPKKTSIKKINTSSVLASGKWVKFEAPEEGIYKIDRDFLTSAGFDLSSIDPRKIKIYNNGGKVLPESVTENRPIDLVENAITIVGEDDGKFDEQDYIIFYGRGTDFWDYDPKQNKIVRFHHPYSNHNYYWITYGGENGKRIQNEASLNTTPEYSQTSTLAFADLDEDKINLAKSGRDYYGDNFTQSVTSHTYINSLNGRISSYPINYRMRFAVASKSGLTLKATENNKSLLSQYLNGYGNADYTVGKLHDNITTTLIGELQEDRSVLKLSIEPSEVNSVGYLDYFEISYVKDLKAFDNKILFFSKDTTAVIEYSLHDFPSTDISVYDVSDPANVKLITNPVLLSGGDCKFQIAETEGSVSKYIGLSNKNFLTPVNPVSVENSDLRGIQDGAKYIIISPKEFLDAANRLKNFRESEAVVPISTIVVRVDQIFNEFSCGILDVSAIRDFIKYAYDNWQITPESVLFFGKGTFDYKNTEGFNDNFVPTWQTKESLVYIQGGDSYTADDFYVKMDNIIGFPEDNIDLIPARITAASLTQANDYVTKDIDYELNSENGVWKNTMTLVADDALTTKGPEANLHTPQMETIANSIIPKLYNLDKIYLADYPTIITSAGRRKPQVNTAIIDAINRGTVLLNYIGHGNPEVWTHEYVFEKSVTIPQLHNKDYFFLVAATCDFAYYDVPNESSSTDELVLKPDGGAIAALSSVRVVTSSANDELNRAFMTNLLVSPRDTLNLMKTIGSVYFATRQNRNRANDRKFHLFGDPLLRLQVPRYKGTIDTIDGKSLTTDIQLKALSSSEVSGTILTPQGLRNENFNGEGILTIFDSERIKKLEQLGNYQVVIPGGVIFKGRVSVNNGEFKANFVVPKDISYENKNGKIIFYFFDDKSDGIAFTNQITVGGTDTTAVNDGTGPEIEVFLDNTASYNAYLVGPQPDLIVKLSDETGLNTTGTGVGHKLEGILNQDESNPLDFTSYFTGDLDAAGKSGEINYKFDKLAEGEYSLIVKAWDVFNNYSSETTYFSVVADDQLVVRDVYNYPNPFRSNTTFTFQHSLNQPVDVKVKIYTIAGRMIKEIESNNVGEKFVKINWDGRDGDGDMIANGTYLYKIIVKSSDGAFNRSVLGKLAVIR